MVFVHLAGSTDLIGGRLAVRTDHYMPPRLLASQLATLEPPDPDERALSVGTTRAPEVAAEIVRRLSLTPTRPRPLVRPTIPTLRRTYAEPSCRYRCHRRSERLTEINIAVGRAESEADRSFFERLLAPAFTMGRPDGERFDDRKRSSPR